MLAIPQKLLNRAKKSTTDALKTDSKRAIQKTEESTGDLVSNKTANKITSMIHKQMSMIKKYLKKDIYIYIYISRRNTENYFSSEINIIV